MGPLVLWWDERIMRAQTRAARRTATHPPWNLVDKTLCGPDLDERWTISNLQPNERRGMRTGTSINVCTSQDFGHSLPHHCRDKQTRLTICIYIYIFIYIYTPISIGCLTQLRYQYPSNDSSIIVQVVAGVVTHGAIIFGGNLGYGNLGWDTFGQNDGIVTIRTALFFKLDQHSLAIVTGAFTRSRTAFRLTAPAMVRCKSAILMVNANGMVLRTSRDGIVQCTANPSPSTKLSGRQVRRRTMASWNGMTVGFLHNSSIHFI